MDRAILWKCEVLDEIFLALGRHETLRASLVFKGAQVLNRRLNDEGRQSQDLDGNLSPDCALTLHERVAIREFLEEHVPVAVKTHFENQSPVRFSLLESKVSVKPGQPHWLGWDRYTVTLRIRDESQAIDPLPNVELELMPPEKYSADSIADLSLGTLTVRAATLHRIAGEKLRAYLSILPDHRRKMNLGKPHLPRVKDLHDLSRVLRARPITETEFWNKVAVEFKLACESKYVDCQDRRAFRQQWDVATAVFASDPTIPKHIPMSELDGSLNQILDHLDSLSIFPIAFPLTVAK